MKTRTQLFPIAIFFILLFAACSPPSKAPTTVQKSPVERSSVVEDKLVSNDDDDDDDDDRDDNDFSARDEDNDNDNDDD